MDMRQKAEVFLAEYQQAYSEALTRARKAKETTDTDTHRKVYADVMGQYRDAIELNGKQLIALGKLCVDQDTSETREKAMTASVKALKEARTMHKSWREKAVLPYSGPVTSCNEIINAALAEAKRADAEEGLVTRGELLDSVTEIVKTWPKVTWDDATGTIAMS